MYTDIQLLAAAFLCCLFLQNTAMANPMQCRPAMLKGMVIGAMPHVRELQNQYEQKSYSTKCRHVLLMKDFPGCNLTGMERLPLSLYRLSLVVEVLEKMAPDSLVKSNLETFAIVHTELSKCEATKAPQGEVCQKRLMKNIEKVSTECLQRDVLINLVRTLLEDVDFVLNGGHHRGVQKGSLPVNPNVQSSNKLKGKGKHKGKKTKKSKAKSAKPAAQQKI